MYCKYYNIICTVKAKFRLYLLYITIASTYQISASHNPKSEKRRSCLCKFELMISPISLQCIISLKSESMAIVNKNINININTIFSKIMFPILWMVKTRIFYNVLNKIFHQ
jgi:hypothetical protein